MSRLTRRGALALLGTLAGCSDANPLDSGSESPELDAAAIRAAVDGSAPTVPARLPIDIGADHLAATERRARSLLDAVPASLGPDEVPNGAIRERVRDARSHAAERLSAATEAPTPFERLVAFADARADARFAAGAWRAIDEGLTREDLAAEAETVRADRRTLRERWRYVGADPVEATLVHAAIEERIASGRHDVVVDQPHRYRPGNPLGVGEVAEAVERARVAVEDAAHCYDRLTASLDDPVDLRPRLDDARRRLHEAFEDEQDALSSVDPREPWRVEGVDVADTPAAEALEELFRPVDPADDDDGWADGTPAEALTWAHASFVTLEAFLALRERVREGETFAIESAADVGAVRTAAVEALRAAEESPGEPALTRHSTTELADQLAWADEELLTQEGSVRAAWLRNDAATFLTVEARARATPAASRRVAEALRTG
ncbi:hypothetical protein EI982_13775 [Haloplanus rallus]|uniref:DUF885 family protein n=1 Tax=Haloplanus rallus TaxID=1816183 RepID=A0A6B9F5W9_9EURY|nr:hypothetical protein [Haloplanus rallus]QGX95778.1 hypothetical protein EI982_13775 [Haloplanus rallus]